MDPKDETNNQHLLTVAEVAEYLRVSRGTVWRWCQDGTIPAFRVGRVWRIPKEELLGIQVNEHQGIELNANQTE